VLNRFFTLCRRIHLFADEDAIPEVATRRLRMSLSTRRHAHCSKDARWRASLRMALAAALLGLAVAIEPSTKWVITVRPAPPSCALLCGFGRELHVDDGG
jgi:hypothetical protein